MQAIVFVKYSFLCGGLALICARAGTISETSQSNKPPSIHTSCKWQQCNSWNVVVLLALADRSSEAHFNEIQQFLLNVTSNCPLLGDSGNNGSIVRITSAYVRPVDENSIKLFPNMKCASANECNELITSLKYDDIAIPSDTDLQAVSFPVAELFRLFTNEVPNTYGEDKGVVVYLVSDYISDEMESNYQWIVDMIHDFDMPFHIVNVLRNSFDRSRAKKAYNLMRRYSPQSPIRVHILSNPNELSDLVFELSSCPALLPVQPATTTPTDKCADAGRQLMPPDCPELAGEQLGAINTFMDAHFTQSSLIWQDYFQNVSQPPWRLVFVFGLSRDQQSAELFSTLKHYMRNTSINCLNQEAEKIRVLSHDFDSDWCTTADNCSAQIQRIKLEQVQVNDGSVEDTMMRDLLEHTLSMLYDEKYCGLTAVFLINDFVSDPLSKASKRINCRAQQAQSLLIVSLVRMTSNSMEDFLIHEMFKQKYNSQFTAVDLSLETLLQMSATTCYPYVTSRAPPTPPTDPLQMCPGVEHCGSAVTLVPLLQSVFNHSENDLRLLRSFLSHTATHCYPPNNNSVVKLQVNSEHEKSWVTADRFEADVLDATNDWELMIYSDSDVAIDPSPFVHSDASHLADEVFADPVTIASIFIVDKLPMQFLGRKDDIPKHMALDSEFAQSKYRLNPIVYGEPDTISNSIILITNDPSELDKCHKITRRRLTCLSSFSELTDKVPIKEVCPLASRHVVPTSDSLGNSAPARPYIISATVMLSLGAIVIIVVVTFFVYKHQQTKMIWKKRVTIFRIRHESQQLTDGELSEIGGIDQWEVPKDHLRIDYDKKLGSGAFGTVCQGRILSQHYPLNRRATMIVQTSNRKTSAKHNVTVVAVKMLQKHASDMMRGKFNREIDFMKQLGAHAHIVNLVGCVTTEAPYCLLLEYCAHGDLLRFVQKRRFVEVQPLIKLVDHDKESTLSEKELLSFAWQVCDGMVYLSSKQYVHRDLAARNILIDEQRNAKIGDFGQCQLICHEPNDDDNQNVQMGKMAVKWMALESIKHNEFSEKSDVWSYGVLLYELFSLGAIPYADVELIHMLTLLAAGNRLPRPAYASETMYALMASCWLERVQQRPSFEQLQASITRLLDQATEHYGYVNALES